MSSAVLRRKVSLRRSSRYCWFSWSVARVLRRWQRPRLLNPRRRPLKHLAALKEVSNKTGSAAEPPRLRQYFPETMLWLPDAVTDANGQLNLDVPLADSITTWRMTALASSRDGRIGSTTSGLRVFQDFFIDLDLPVALTVDDEVSVPVGVFNYLPDRQTVRLEVAQADWFELLDEPIKSIDIAANDVGVVYFRLRAKSSGLLPFKVSATGHAALRRDPKDGARHAQRQSVFDDTVRSVAGQYRQRAARSACPRKASRARRRSPSRFIRA